MCVCITVYDHDRNMGYLCIGGRWREVRRSKKKKNSILKDNVGKCLSEAMNGQ